MAALPHLRDTRRATGRRYKGWRSDGRAFGQTTQYPVICAADIVEQAETQGCARIVTDDPAAVRCRDCRARIDAR